MKRICARDMMPRADDVQAAIHWMMGANREARLTA